MTPEIIAAVVAAAASVLGTLIAALSKRALALKVGGIEIQLEATQDPASESRLPELRESLARQQSIVSWNGRASAFLTFGEYIVGGVLASSFVQASLAAPLVGSLGVLVLVSSLVHQRYRPDLQASGAKQRAVKLRGMIRAVEDDLYALRSAMKVHHRSTISAKKYPLAYTRLRRVS
jgi:hypothetical protein